MAKITVSYRRSDSDAITGRIFDRLVAHYGADSVFRDIDNIPPGIDFRKHISGALATTDILLAIVGPQWTGKTSDGNIRIQEATDLVRIEVEAALRKDIPVIPVLVGHATMPQPGELPEGLKDFAFRNAVKVDALEDFDDHVKRLIRSLDRLLQSQQPHAQQDESLTITLAEPQRHVAEDKYSPKIGIQPQTATEAIGKQEKAQDRILNIAVPETSDQSAQTSPLPVDSGLRWFTVTAPMVYIGTGLFTWWLTAISTGPNSFAKIAWLTGSVLGALVLIAYALSLIIQSVHGIRALVRQWRHDSKTSTKGNINFEVIATAATLPVTLFMGIIMEDCYGRNQAALSQIMGSTIVAVSTLLFISCATVQMVVGMNGVIEILLRSNLARNAGKAANIFCTSVIALIAIVAVLRIIYANIV